MCGYTNTSLPVTTVTTDMARKDNDKIVLQSLGHSIFDIPFIPMERGNSLFGFKKVLLGSILRFDTEFNIAMPDDNYVTKYVRNCVLDEEISNMQLKEWSRNLNEELLYCNSKHSKKGDSQLDRLEGDIDALKRANHNIKQTNELLTNKIDNLTSILEKQSLMIEGYFGKDTVIENNFNKKNSNEKELIDLTEKKTISKTLTINHLMDNAKKGTVFNNIFGETTSSDPAKMEFNWIMNQLIIKNIKIKDITYKNAGFKSKQIYDKILKCFLQFENKCTQDDKDYIQQLSCHKFKKGTEEYITLIGKLGKRVWNITDNVIKEWQAEFTARFNYPKKKQTHVTWINIERKKNSVLNVKTCTINQFHNLMRCVKKNRADNMNVVISLE